MKNIAVFAILVIMFFSGSLASYAQNYTFFISPQAGFVYGQALELVYQDDRNDREFLSRLNWDMKPVYYLGLEAGVGKTDIMSSAGFFSSVSFKIGIPSDSGKIENRDWQSDKHNSLTDFSKHTNRTMQFFWLDADIGASFPVESFAYLKLFISGSWMRFAFEGRNGYGEYPPGSTPQNFRGTVITYKQDWLLIAMGLTVGTKYFYPFSFDFSFRFSPFTYCIAVDEHITRKMTFKDYTRYGLYLEPGCSISFSFQKVDLSLGFNYKYIGYTTGFTYINNNSYSEANNESGAGLSLLDTKLLVKIRF